jgi:hypothetical protein
MAIKGPPKLIQIGIFGLKIYHLATLTGMPKWMGNVIALFKGSS